MQMARWEKIAAIVILFVRMWVEISWHDGCNRDVHPSSSSWGCELKYWPFRFRKMLTGHPLREDVSWNIKQNKVHLFQMSHPLREDVSWNEKVLYLDLCNLVILFVRMWVEMTDEQIKHIQYLVILFVRMWVEMQMVWLFNGGQDRVILFVRMWVEIYFGRFSPHSKYLSSSSWGCELKWNRGTNRRNQQGHPLREDVSWNVCIVSPAFEIISRHPLREDVSWNNDSYAASLKAVVILFVRMWVEMILHLNLIITLLSSSSWGCELK